MKKCVAITTPESCVAKIDMSKYIPGDPYLNGIVSYHGYSQEGFCVLTLGGCVLVRRKDLKKIADAGLRFVQIEEGDKLFKKDSLGQKCFYLGEHHCSGDCKENVVICLGGRDITKTIEKQRAKV